MSSNNQYYHHGGVFRECLTMVFCMLAIYNGVGRYQYYQWWVCSVIAVFNSSGIQSLTMGLNLYQCANRLLWLWLEIFRLLVRYFSVVVIYQWDVMAIGYGWLVLLGGIT